MPTFYDQLLKIARDAGVRHLYGVPGDALNPLTEALRKQSEITWVRTAHEEGAAFAASGAAKLTHQVQLCAGTVGPGALHLINGLADANKDGAPVVAILGQVPQKFRGSDYFQELDLRTIFAPVVNYIVEVEDAASAPNVFVEAFHRAITRGGVSALIVPASVGKSEVEDREVRLLRPEEVGRLHPAPELLDRAARVLDEEPRITILAGVGSRGASREVLALAERLQAPIIRSLKAKDLYPDDHPLVCGELGIVGSRRAVEAMRQCGVLLMVGSDFPYREWFNPRSVVIQIDTRAEALGRRSPTTLPVHADAKVTLQALLERVCVHEPRPAEESLLSQVWDKAMAHQEEVDPTGAVIHPQSAVRLLSELAPDDAIFTCDTGTSTVWAARHLHLRGTQRLTFCANLGSMAYALPAAIGSALSAPGRSVIALTGDGAFNMLMGELLTVVAQQLDVKVVVLDNGKVGLIQMEQEQEGYPESFTAQHNPDYAMFARACGAAGFTVERPGELRATLQAFLAHKGPAVLGIRVDPDELIFPPKVSLNDALHFGLAKAHELFE